MRIKKMSFADIEGTMCKEEMKLIMGGSGSNWGGTGGSYTNGSLTYGGSNPPAYNGSGGFYGNTQGWSSGFNNFGSGTSSSSSSGGGGSTSQGPGLLTNGWFSTNNGIKTTNTVFITRYFEFIDRNPNLTTSQVFAFIMNEGTLAGQQQNNLQLYGTILNNVNVQNNYKGPSKIAPGVIYNNGELYLNNSVYGGSNSGVGTSKVGLSYVTKTSSSPTFAKLTDFDRNDIFYGFKKIDFSNIGKQKIVTFNQATRQFDYNKTFEPVMKLNIDGAVAIANYEKLSLTVYDRDSNTGQNATIGFGHLLHKGPIKVGDIQSISFDQAISYLANDILDSERALNQKIENMGLTGQFNRNQYFALIDMAYNAGLSEKKDQESVTYQVMNAMKTGGVGAANQIITNFYQKETGGLQERRYFEAQAFIYGRILTPEQANTELTALGIKK
jgi:GH24 family phage-related lysozyme (muramidase)